MISEAYRDAQQSACIIPGSCFGESPGFCVGIFNNPSELTEAWNLVVHSL